MTTSIFRSNPGVYMVRWHLYVCAVHVWNRVVHISFRSFFSFFSLPVFPSLCVQLNNYVGVCCACLIRQ